MKEDDLKLIASLVDWSDSLVNKIFYKTYGAVLHQKFNEFEEEKKKIKEFIRNNFGNDEVRKTPRRLNKTTRLLEQIQQLELANFDEDESDSKAGTSRAKNNTRLPPNVLRQLENITLQDKPIKRLQPAGDARQDQPAKGVLQPKGDGGRALAANRPHSPETGAHVSSVDTPKLRKRLLATTMQSSSAKRAEPILKSFKKQEEQVRIKQKEILAAKRRDEALKTRSETIRRANEERQRRVEMKRLLKEEQERKRLQALREQELRERNFRQAQEDLERGMRSPLPKARKLAVNTPKAAATPTIAATSQRRNPYVNSCEEMSSPAKVVIADVQDTYIVDDLQTGDETDNDEEENAPEEIFESAHESNLKRTRSPSFASMEAVNEQQQQEQQREPKTASSQPQQAQQPRGNSYDITPDKVFIPSTKDNYNVDDLSSGDETDNEENPRKQIPKWAHESNLKRRIALLRTLLTDEQRERHFGVMQNPDVNEFFKHSTKKYGTRSSSAIWESPMSNPKPGHSRYHV